MGSIENYHAEIIRRLQSGELLLGVNKMAGAHQKSIAFSQFWTMFPFLAVGAYIGIPWYLDSPRFWWYVIFSPVALIIGIIIRKKRGMAKASKLAKSDPYAFMRLWDEGALSLKLPNTDDDCVSPQDDYQQFVARNFLLR